MIKTNHPKDRGFTLIELMVVLLIIALLSGIVFVSTSGAKSKARDAQRVSDLSQLQWALAMFMDRCGQYPPTSSGTLTISAACPTNPAITLNLWIPKIPTPPSGAGQASYDYAVLSNNSSSLVANYVLHAKLESKGNAAISRGLSAANIPQPTGYTWSPLVTADPYRNCSNDLTTSVEYCTGPNN